MMVAKSCDNRNSAEFQVFDVFDVFGCFWSPETEDRGIGAFFSKAWNRKLDARRDGDPRRLGTFLLVNLKSQTDSCPLTSAKG